MKRSGNLRVDMVMMTGVALRWEGCAFFEMGAGDKRRATRSSSFVLMLMMLPMLMLFLTILEAGKMPCKKMMRGLCG